MDSSFLQLSALAAKLRLAGTVCAVMRLFKRSIGLAVLTLVVLLTAQTALGRSVSLVIHPVFHRVLAHAYGIGTNGRFLFACDSMSVDCSLGTIVDGRRATQSALSAPANCDYAFGSDLIGGPWLLRDCGTGQQPAIQLHRLSGGGWETADTRALSTFCAPSDTQCDVPPVAVGTFWIEWSLTCYHCQSIPPEFTSIASGAVRSAPSGSQLVLDLDSPTLSRPICASVPTSKSASVGFYGHFLLVTPSPTARHSYLERCRSHLHLVLPPGPVVGDARFLMWPTRRPTVFRGLYLPSLRTFRFYLPSRLHGAEPMLAGDRLYLTDSAGTVWATRAPTQPPLH
jgi:hypothetical protein